MKKNIKDFISRYNINNNFNDISIIKNNKIVYSTSNMILDKNTENFIKKINFITYYHFNINYNLLLYSEELKNCEIYNMCSDIYFQKKSTYKNSFIFPLHSRYYVKIDTNTNDYAKYVFAKYLILILNKYIKYL